MTPTEALRHHQNLCDELHQLALEENRFLKQNQRLFDGGLLFTVSWAGTTGDRAVAEWTNQGTTRAGAPYRNRGCTVFRHAGGRVVEIHDYLDTEILSETWPA